jgi:hypothetical protein
MVFSGGVMAVVAHVVGFVGEVRVIILVVSAG